ncbi:MAG: T9SS type A sorting domain-containing protein [Bacteroidota bacterium]
MKHRKLLKSYISISASKFALIMFLLLSGALLGEQLFAQNYTINTNTVGNGSVVRDPSTGTYPAGTTVKLEAVADAGWTFVSWSGDLSGTTNPTSILMDGDKTVTATFTQDSYTLSVIVTGSGTVNLTPSGGTYLSGTEVELDAVADAGWTFTGWSGDLSGSTNPEKITMDGDKTVTATFTQDSYTLSVIVAGSGSVNLTPSGGTYLSGTEVDLDAVAAAGWTFTGWSGDLSGSTNPETITMDGDKTVTAIFTQDSYTLTVNVTGSGSVNLDPSGGTYLSGTEVDLDAVADAGWTFTGWSGDLSGSTNPEKIIMDGDKTVTATFTQDIYILTVNVTGSGSVNLTPSGGTYLSGTEVDLDAVADAGWTFTGWAGDLSGSTNPETIVMDGDKTVTANFVQVTYELTVVTDGTPGATVDPNGTVIVFQGESTPISATVPVGYQFIEWTVTGGTGAAGVIFVDANQATTNVTLTTGEATIQANFQKVLEIKDVKIPNVTMKIGDMVTATINVSDDAGGLYTLVAGSIAGYPLGNLERQNATTYLASFTITEGGSSYPALADIPVINLILSDGIIQNVPYNNPIVQSNDPLDAKVPVINTMTVASMAVKVGDIVTLNINADSTYYTAHPLTTINGTAVSEPNVTFVEVGNGDYRLIYTVLEGDNDVLAGELEASVILVKPSGNFNVVPYEIITPNTLWIDAHAPVIERMEVSQTEVGVGNTVQLVITADSVGYTGGLGTVINGVPLSSDRVSMVELSEGLYVLNYLVASGDNNVSPGNLTASVVMTDLAGNNSIPNVTIVANTLEIYTELPVAAMAAPPEICEGEPAELTIFLSGRGPWGFDLNDGTTVTSYELIAESTYKIPITPEVTTTYKIDTVWDKNGVVNTGAGSVQVIVNEIEDVQFTNLASGYSIEDDPFQLTALPTGGDFSGPGVVPATGFFYPEVAGTENSPHSLFYTLVNAHGCASVDTALVFVLGAEGDIHIPDTSFCNNSDPFIVTASNLAGATGSFTLTNINNMSRPGLTDNGDNTAQIQPALLQEGKYVVVYEYFDVVTLFLRDTFSIRSIEVPIILNLDTVYCQSEDPVILESSVAGAVFSGPGVSGNLTDGFVFHPNLVEAGSHTIECTVTSDNGCIAIAMQNVTIKFAPEVGFELSAACISDDGGMLSFVNTTGNKLQVESWAWNFGDPGSGDDNLSDLINPTHFYAEPGERIISLTASTFEGCVVNYVMDTVIGNMPVADFTWKSDCFVGENGTLFLNRSISEFGPPVGTEWIFKESDGTLIEKIVSDAHIDSITYNFGSEGDYLVEFIAKSSLVCTDTMEKEISLKPTIILGEAGYSEGFNASQALWTVQSEEQIASWVWNAPNFDGFVPNQADKAWFTRLPEGVVGYLEHSWMQSPCFDLSGMKHPLIQMDIMKSFAAGSGALLQYMDLFEEGWKTIGEETPGIAWYNTDSIESLPGGSSVGWGWDLFNPDSDWITAAHDLEELAGKPNVSFRVAFATDESQSIGNQGFAFDNLFIMERTKRVVLEHFTNSSDASSAAADDVVDAFGSDYSSDIIDIHYHMDYPGIDPMNQNNPDPSDIRSFTTGIPNVPYAILDGGISEEFRYDFTDLKTTPNVENMKLLSLQVPSFDVNLEVTWLDQSLEATTSVTCDVDHYAEYIQLYVVVFETSINAYTGINGDTAFRNVVLDMLPTPAGKLLGDNWSQGSNDTRVNTWTYQPFVEDVEDLAVVAFVQDRNSKQILQAAVEFKTPQVGIGKKPIQMDALHIYPNPASDLVYVNLGRPSERDGRFEIIDMNGRIVHNEHVPMGYQVCQLEIQSLNRGFYMIQWYEAGTLKGRNKLVKVD